MAEGEETDDADKTEDPSARKLEESRKKGQVALSREVNNWVMLLAGTILILGFGPLIAQKMAFVLRVFIAQPHTLLAGSSIGEIFAAGILEVFGILFLPLAFLMFMAAAAPFVQIGPLFSAESLKPSLSKISPLKGFKRLFSMRSLVEFTKGIIKLAIVTTIGLALLSPFYAAIEHFVGMEFGPLLDDLRALVLRLMLGVLGVLFVVAGLDFAYQRMEHTKKMRMSKQEVKDEYKQTEGDPHVKAKLRQLRAQKAQQRMMQAVPESDVVITNPTHFAVALKYNPDEMDAPVVVAKGMDAVAARIREVANEHDIPLYEAPPLARTLYATVEIDEMIKPEQFQAVAEVISWVFQMRQQMGGKKK